MDIDGLSQKQLIEEREHLQPRRVGFDVKLATKSLAQIRNAARRLQQLPYPSARPREIQVELALGVHHNKVLVHPRGNPSFAPGNYGCLSHSQQTSLDCDALAHSIQVDMP